MSLKISRILHAGYLFEHDGTQIAFDTIFENPFSRNCYAFPSVKFDVETIQKLHLDAVFISHHHDDHCSLESLNLLDRKTPIYIYCLHEELFSWIRELGFANVYSLPLDVPVRVGGFEIIPRRALDADVDSIFHIKAEGLNILNVVDSWIDDETLTKLAQSAPWDMVLWPFQTMREVEVLAPSRASKAPNQLPEEWIEQLKILNPRFVVPSSCQFLQEPWSWYNHAFFPITYEQFQKEIEVALPQTQVVRMNPSASIFLNKDSVERTDALTWVLPLGAQDVDYKYDPDLQPPKTAIISQQFTALTEIQAQGALEYCRTELLEKYRSMEAPEYFERQRFWHLSVYDHAGKPTHFFYCIQGVNIELVYEQDTPIAWRTEVPIAKLFAALEWGESLTSMYMRINDIVFEADIENEVADVDIVEDPLIRCLFNGVFGSYQRAQLKRLNTI